MKPYKNILVATNLSEESAKIVTKAQQIAQIELAELNIVHVLDASPLVYGGEYALSLSKNLDKSIEKQALEMLNQQAEKFNIPPANRFLEKGSAVEGILNLLHKLNINLLILGNHEVHGVGILVGSTTNTMLHKMPCDVLAVHI